ncbi:hypothetical protein SYJ56_06780 [Algoriphagus sp. D3-2-R+10]|nr:hypothetical protein [Algoriphagus sp. D3-2-R+10]MEB2775003.1 hypothetical protein [Algoriphagus sp. D3-2-R+10]
MTLTNIGHAYGIYGDSSTLYFQPLKWLASKSFMPTAFMEILQRFISSH